jgi:alkylation response protein AidB-like acyl-CoA dehydrogenase
MAADIEALKVLLYRQAWMIDNNIPCIKETALTKDILGGMMLRNADEAIQILGGYGLCKEYPFERFYRDWKLASIGGGTAEVNRDIAARFLLK